MKKYLPILSIWMLLTVFAVWYFGYPTPPSQIPIPENIPANQEIKPGPNPVEAWDPKLCETAPQWIRQICKDAVYLELAKKSKKVADCNSINDQQKQSSCKNMLAPMDSVPAASQTWQAN